MRVARTAEFRLTKTEQAALLDRLSQSFLIASVLTDHAEGERPAAAYPEKAIAARATLLAQYVETTHVIPETTTDLDRAIFVEAIEGSVWGAGFESHQRHAKAAARRTLRNLAHKMISAGIANQIDIP